jgi:hypothetical protein
VREITARDLLARDFTSQKTERRGGSRDGIGLKRSTTMRRIAK